MDEGSMFLHGMVDSRLDGVEVAASTAFYMWPALSMWILETADNSRIWRKKSVKKSKKLRDGWKLAAG